MEEEEALTKINKPEKPNPKKKSGADVDPSSNYALTPWIYLWYLQ